MRSLFAPLLALFLTACQATAVDGLIVTAMPLWPDPPADRRLGRTEVLALHRLQGPRSWFGGLSGAEWDGDALLAVSDVGGWVRLDVTSDADGRPQSFGRPSHGRLAGIGTGKNEGDAEELARMPDGFAVAFERHHRVLLYQHGLDQPPRPYDIPADTAQLDDNGGLEAMTRLTDGRLVLIAEGEDDAASSPLWIEETDGWRRAEWPHHGLFRPTAAATLPDGSMLVVERRFTVIGGPAMRLVHVPVAALAGASISGEEWALLEPPLTVDNFEAIAIRPRADGRLVATLLSDDNFHPLQSTLMLTLLLP